MRYPAIEPDECGMLDVGDGQSLYWEVCGNASGKPALVLHGGPGSGCSPYMRSLWTHTIIGSCSSISAAPDTVGRTRAIRRWTCQSTPRATSSRASKPSASTLGGPVAGAGDVVGLDSRVGLRPALSATGQRDRAGRRDHDSASRSRMA